MLIMTIYFDYGGGTVLPSAIGVFDSQDALEKLKQFCTNHDPRKVVAIATDFEFPQGWDWIIQNGS